MPLSEHEERILAEIERHLAADDPRFAARTRRRQVSRTTRLRLAAVLGVLGVIGLLSLTFGTAYAVAGMVMLFAAILLGVSTITEEAERAQEFVPPDERA